MGVITLRNSNCFIKYFVLSNIQIDYEKHVEFILFEIRSDYEFHLVQTTIK